MDGLPTMALRPFRQVCVVGAGPAGLQFGHFLSKDTSHLNDFVIFEKSPSAGRFFRRFPIHRMLISLNKRHVRSGSAEFRMRHDWNSLLGTDTLDIAPVTARTKELYPHADILAKYLEDYSQHLLPYIEFNVEVLRLSREDGQFNLELQSLDRNATKSQQRCGLVVLAQGLTPQIPEDFVGAELLTGYEELQSSEMYENRSVLVWGFGNAAHETARELQKFTQDVTLLHRTRGEIFSGHGSTALPRFAFFTHYPGDVRTVTMQIYDSYLLKALDVKLPYSEDEEPVFLRCGHQICVWVSKSHRCAGAGVEGQILPDRWVNAASPRECVVEAGPFSSREEQQVQRHLLLLARRGNALEEFDFRWRTAQRSQKQTEEVLLERLRDLGFGSLEEYQSQYEGLPSAFARWHTAKRLEVSTAFLQREASFLLLLARLRPFLGTEPLRHPVDVAVRCLGWRAALPAGLEETGKYPAMDTSYQSVKMKNLYFTGAVAHGRSTNAWYWVTGSYMISILYVARALYRILRQPFAGWPNQSFPIAKKEWMQQVLRRINEASGPYQMFGELVDAVLFSATEICYLEELPLAYAQQELKKQPRLLLSFVYGRRFSAMDLPSPGAVGPDHGELSAFLHPQLELLTPPPCINESLWGQEVVVCVSMDRHFDATEPL
eukprot:symbB.v1.2.027760.t1/scaffold2735.1/size73862/8